MADSLRLMLQVACDHERRLEHVDVDESYRIITTEHEALNPDRQLAPRGDTPTRTVSPICGPEDVPASYYGRGDEYRALLSRGATPAMCELFGMEFSEEQGIVAWATEDTYKEFAGPAITCGDYWKIYLGRRIELEKGDPSGKHFVESLLEEVVFYPVIAPHRLCRHGEQWETVQEEYKIWATRPSVRHAGKVELLLESEEVDPEQACEHAREALELNAMECDEALDKDYGGSFDDLYPRCDRYPLSDVWVEGLPQPGLEWPLYGWDTVWNDEANGEHGEDSEDDEAGEDIDELFSGDELVLEEAGAKLEALPVSQEEW
ncbi:hypothetical protein M0805_009209 [Coniferiporia weirii]|nr:hypothetical protein M0805_009209 [Coniferiporia weirii]